MLQGWGEPSCSQCYDTHEDQLWGEASDSVDGVSLRCSGVSALNLRSLGAVCVSAPPCCWSSCYSLRVPGSRLGGLKSRLRNMMKDSQSMILDQQLCKRTLWPSSPFYRFYSTVSLQPIYGFWDSTVSCYGKLESICKIAKLVRSYVAAGISG